MTKARLLLVFRSIKALTRAEMTFRLTDQLNILRSDQSLDGGIWPRDVIDSENQSNGKIVSGKRVHLSKYHDGFQGNLNVIVHAVFG